jgi:hypothetical protein
MTRRRHGIAWAHHTSAKVTLDTYADLFDDDLDAVAVTLDSRYSRESVAKMWPRGSEDVR